MLDLIEAVRSQHRRILEHLDAVVAAADVHPAASDYRRRAVERLVVEASRHEAAEELYIWPLVRDLFPTEVMLTRVGHRQERRAKRLLHDLERAATRHPSSRPNDVERLAEQAATVVRDHVAYEEVRILDRLREALRDDDALRLGDLFVAAHARAPTRPHPLTPAIPGILKTVGRAAAISDRARDLVGRRAR